MFRGVLFIICKLPKVSTMDAKESKDMTAQQFYSDERHIEMWKIKRLIKKLINTKG